MLSLGILAVAFASEPSDSHWYPDSGPPCYVRLKAIQPSDLKADVALDMQPIVLVEGEGCAEVPATFTLREGDGGPIVAEETVIVGPGRRLIRLVPDELLKPDTRYELDLDWDGDRRTPSTFRTGFELSPVLTGEIAVDGFDVHELNQGPEGVPKPLSVSVDVTPVRDPAEASVLTLRRVGETKPLDQTAVRGVYYYDYEYLRGHTQRGWEDGWACFYVEETDGAGRLVDRSPEFCQNERGRKRSCGCQAAPSGGLTLALGAVVAAARRRRPPPG